MNPTTQIKPSQQPVVGSSPKEITPKRKARTQNNQRLDAYLKKLETLVTTPNETFLLAHEEYTEDAA